MSDITATISYCESAIESLQKMLQSMKEQLGTKETAKAEPKTEAKAEKKEEPAPQALTQDHVRTVLVAFANIAGPSINRTALDMNKIANLKACPDDKLADVLGNAVHLFSEQLLHDGKTEEEVTAQLQAIGKDAKVEDLASWRIPF